MKNEFEVLPEVTRVEDTCDLLVLVVTACVPFKSVVVVALWPVIDPESVPPNISAIAPKPSSITMTTTATGLFEWVPLV